MRRYALRYVVLAGLVVSGCDGPSHHGVLETIGHQEEAAPVVVEGVDYWLDGLKSEPYDNGEFSVRTRTDQLVQYPCARCHSETMGRDETTDQIAPERAHRQVLRPHGDAEALTCLTCHGNSDPAELSALDGVSVGLNQSYDLCATCHFEQRRDWQAGAHGKRLAAWSGPRIIESCTGCHDPHAPAFEVRLPATMFRGEGGD